MNKHRNSTCIKNGETEFPKYWAHLCSGDTACWHRKFHCVRLFDLTNGLLVVIPGDSLCFELIENVKICRHCPKCPGGIPMMRDREKNEYCVACREVMYFYVTRSGRDLCIEVFGM